jgi:hypothetical protein
VTVGGNSNWLQYLALVLTVPKICYEKVTVLMLLTQLIGKKIFLQVHKLGCIN